MTLERLKPNLHGIAYAMLMVIAVAAVMRLLREIGFPLQSSMLFIIPVLIAGSRWGLIPALAAAAGGIAISGYFTIYPLRSFAMQEPQSIVRILLYIFVAVVTSHLSSQLKRQIEISRQREIDVRDLYAFSRRLAVAFDVPEIHAAIEDHLASVTERRVILFANATEAASGKGRRGGTAVPEKVRTKVVEIADNPQAATGSALVTTGQKETWLVRAVSPKSPEFGIVAVNLGREHDNIINELRVRVETALADATATLERLGVAHAISEARMRAQTDQLREALIGSVSHELRTPLASIMGAATVLGSAPALAREGKLKALVTDVHDEAERLNHDIQNLLDASRISSDGINPKAEWADPADIINSALDRCRRRLEGHPVSLDVPPDLPVLHVDPVLVKQSLVQVFDNAAKYSPPGTPIDVVVKNYGRRISITVSDSGAGLTESDKMLMLDRFFRGERHVATTSGSGLGLWIANAFVDANGGRLITNSDGPNLGSAITIELPVAEAALTHVDNDADE
jgi:two-component system sensor histidine kinase KdpD